MSAVRAIYEVEFDGRLITVDKCSWWQCNKPIVAFDLERLPQCEEHAGCCPICGQADCDVMPCRECGASLCAGEPHDDLCCATGLSRLDREEMAEDEERSLLDDLREAREAAIAAGDEPVDVRAMLAALDDDCEHCAEAAELAESEDR